MTGPGTSQNQDWTRRSLAHVWHPCTQMQDHEWLPLVPIRSAEGVWLEDFDGRRYLDAVSSWWTNIFGHRHPHIVARLKEQLDRLDHVLLAGFTHEPVVRLSERLCAIAPPGLERCFYADNGSSAVEVALKMSAHFWRNSGQPAKTRYIALSNGYHGETLGALAVSGGGMYRDAYAPLLMEPLYVRSPDCFERAPGESWEDHSRRRFHDMELALQQHAGTVAAVILEPLVQCAGGMRMYHPIYLRMLRDACTRHGVHLIADEIAVGFGRTGRMFAWEWAFGQARNDPRSFSAGQTRSAKDGQEAGNPSTTSPDFLCLSKGLTAGTLPLSVVMTTDAVYQAFYGDYASGKAFLHSHSFTGNPLACSAALATLELFEQSDVLGRNRGLAQLMWASMLELSRHRHVADLRQQGMILAVELAQDPRKRQPYPAAERRGLRVYQYGLEHGALLRPLGNVVYLMPPYVIEPAEVLSLCRTAIEGIDAATRN